MDLNRILPLGIQDFEKLRKEGCLYVDKTILLYNLTRTNSPFFLSRPRRFGKSLFLSTLKVFFLGKKELFKGLKINDLETDWIEYPVIYLDFSKTFYENIQSIYDVLDNLLSEYENELNIKELPSQFSIRFENIIKGLKNKTKKNVVVLVDEYDKPLLDTIDNPDLNEKIRNLLKGFYGILKGNDKNLRFLFITGVTKFSKVSVFSDLNHLTDISLNDNFAEICGITENELIENFKPEIKALAEKQNLTYEETLAALKKHYDGYYFSPSSIGIYNPFSLLNTLFSKDFLKYWFKSGTPTFLIKLLKSKNFNILDFEKNIFISVNSIDDYRADHDNLLPILYQSGYLTIKDYDRELNSYLLGFPNEEVKYGFLYELLPYYISLNSNTRDFHIANFVKELRENKIDEFMLRLKAFFGKIPYDLNNKTEKHFQTIFWLLFELLGQFIEIELHNAVGRADAVVKTNTHIYVFEFKISITNRYRNSPEFALDQINSKNYTLQYSVSNKEVVKIGVNFDSKKRTIGDWKIEIEK